MRASPALLALVLLGGCTTTNVGQDRLAERDPLEGFNRAMWGVNRGVDKVVLKPVTQVYRAVAPKPARRGVSNFFSNLGEPWSFINNLLQGKPKRALDNLGRFVINSTVGIAGLADPASKMGVKKAPEDFGQTLAAWGVNGGPYLVLPLLGPSTLRDGVGMGVAFAADPYRVCQRECDLPKGVPTALSVTEVIDTRSQLVDSGADSFLDASADSYATARSAFLQRRRAAILNQEDGAPSPAGGTGDADLDAALQDIDEGGNMAAPTVSPDQPTPVETPPASDQPPSN
ncbi:VacJ family lipoprotein [Sphingomonas sp. ID0503]|uniref:MlaA family lipoprotein n=1 Tax=Sphingomonas sp. ID0503 TaxID=3399691 RepID=UPI003AFA35CC